MVYDINLWSWDLYKDAQKTAEQIYLIAEQLNKQTYPLVPIEMDVIKEGDEFNWKKESLKLYLFQDKIDVCFNIINHVLNIYLELKDKFLAVSLINKALETLSVLHGLYGLQTKIQKINFNEIERIVFPIGWESQMVSSYNKKTLRFAEGIRSLIEELKKINNPQENNPSK